MGSNIGSQFDKKEYDKIKRLLQAAKEGSLEEIKFLLDQKVNVDAIDPSDPLQSTPLHLAAENGQTDAARLLLQHGADPNKARVDENGRSPLHLAAGNGHSALIEVLLEYGANIDQTGKMGMTALYRASTTGQLDAARLLIFHGADMHKPDVFGVSALESAVLSKQSALVKLLKIYASIHLYMHEDLLSTMIKDILKMSSRLNLEKKSALEQAIQQHINAEIPKIWENNQEQIKNTLKKYGIPDNELSSYLNNAKEILINCLTVQISCRLSKQLNVPSQNTQLPINQKPAQNNIYEQNKKDLH